MCDYGYAEAEKVSLFGLELLLWNLSDPLFATVYKGNIIKFNNGLPILRRDTAQTRLRAVFL